MLYLDRELCTGHEGMDRVTVRAPGVSSVVWGFPSSAVTVSRPPYPVDMDLTLGFAPPPDFTDGFFALPPEFANDAVAPALDKFDTHASNVDDCLPDEAGCRSP